MMAHTGGLEARRDAREHGGGGAGAGRLGDLADRLGLGGGEVLGDLGGGEAEDHADDDGAEHAGARVAQRRGRRVAVPASLPT